MFQRLTGQLPAWARFDHPVTRYEWGQPNAVPPRTQIIRAVLLVLLGVLLLAGGAAIATNVFQHPAGQTLSEQVIAVLYWPLLLVQILMSVAALVFTVNTIAEQKQRQTWDNLRATAGGVALMLRGRWGSVYYRLRLGLVVVLVLRLLLILGILYDLTAFQGHYLDLLVSGITPTISPLVAALLLAAMMTAALLLPLTGLGLSAALGLLLSVLIQQRTFSTLTLLLGILLRTALAALFISGATQFIQGQLTLADPAAWGLMSGLAAFGDWGLAFLNLGIFSEVWTVIPFAVLFGVVLLVFAILQSAITEWILALTVRLAERNG